MSRSNPRLILKFRGNSGFVFLLVASLILCTPGVRADTLDSYAIEADSDSSERDDDDSKIERDKRRDDRHDDDARKRHRDLFTSDFIDTDFRKPSFRDLLDIEPKDDRDEADDKDDKKDKDKKDKFKDLSGFGERDDLSDVFDEHCEKRKIDKDDRNTLKELTRPIPGMLHDWVPSGADRLLNGGFTNSPDNGFPVPYRLNGHLDIERKLPWEAEP